MKKALLPVMWLTITLTSFGQQITPSQVHTREYYLKRGSSQRTGAFILLVGGAVMIVGAGIWASNNANEQADLGLSALDKPSILAGVGLLSMIGSIPLFVAGHRNLKKAREMAVHFNYSHSIPGLTVKIKL